MTINKSQDQTIEQEVEIHLQEEVFSHEQLYVVFSRECAFDNSRVYVNNITLTN